jgi:hypothetical protein
LARGFAHDTDSVRGRCWTDLAASLARGLAVSSVLDGGIDASSFRDGFRRHSVGCVCPMSPGEDHRLAGSTLRFTPSSDQGDGFRSPPALRQGGMG